MQHINYYDILGIKDSATQAEIKSAYRSLSKKYHPDVNDAGNANTYFRLLTEAYETLSNPGKRAAYDSQSTTASTNHDYAEEYTTQTYTEYPRPKLSKRTPLQITFWILKLLFKIVLLPIIPIMFFLGFVAAFVSVIANIAITLMLLIIGLVFIITLFQAFSGDAPWSLVLITVVLGGLGVGIVACMAFLPTIFSTVTNWMIDFVRYG